MSTVEAVLLAALASTNVKPNTPTTDVAASRQCPSRTGSCGEGGTEDAGINVDAYGLLGRCVSVCWSALRDVDGEYVQTYGPLPGGGLQTAWRAVYYRVSETARLLADRARRLQRRQCPIHTPAGTGTRTATAVPVETVVVVVGAPHSGLRTFGSMGSSWQSGAGAAVATPASGCGSSRLRFVLWTRVVRLCTVPKPATRQAQPSTPQVQHCCACGGTVCAAPHDGRRRLCE
jgi:hypothetical protein